MPRIFAPYKSSLSKQLTLVDSVTVSIFIRFENNARTGRVCQVRLCNSTTSPIFSDFQSNLSTVACFWTDGRRERRLCVRGYTWAILNNVHYNLFVICIKESKSVRLTFFEISFTYNFDYHHKRDKCPDQIVIWRNPAAWGRKRKERTH